jgi:hypothetical protein
LNTARHFTICNTDVNANVCKLMYIVFPMDALTNEEIKAGRHCTGAYCNTQSNFSTPSQLCSKNVAI